MNDKNTDTVDAWQIQAEELTRRIARAKEALSQMIYDVTGTQRLSVEDTKAEIRRCRRLERILDGKEVDDE